MMPLVEFGTSIALIKAVICFYGFILFAWWWQKKGNASSVYICVTFILLGLAIDNFVESYAQYRWLNYREDEVRYTIWWPLRLVPSILPLCGMVWHLTVRALTSRKMDNNV